MVALVALHDPLPAQAQSPAQPIELPEFIVTGKEQVGIPGATKQAPVRPPMLSKGRMDSLNPVEKLPLPSVPSVPFPTYSNPLNTFPGYVVGEFGNYTTPSLAAGYSFRAADYLIDVAGNIEGSNGWTNGADYVRGGIDVFTTYIAPEKFIVFGGSTTHVDVAMEHAAYNLFARPDNAARIVTSGKAGVQTSGGSEIGFKGDLYWKGAGIVDAETSSDAGILGSLQIMRTWNNGGVGGLVELSLPQYAGSVYGYTMAAARGEWTSNGQTFMFQAGAQVAGTTEDKTRYGIALKASASIPLSKDVTINVNGISGLRHLRVMDLLQENPYLAQSVQIDVPYDRIDINAGVRYHPTLDISLSGGLRLRSTDRDNVWMSADTGMFEPSWMSTTTIQLYGNMRWEVHQNDVVSADLRFTSASLADGVSVPYVTPVQGSVSHDRRWTDRLRSTVSLVYIAQRYADVANTIVLDGYIDVRAEVHYSVLHNIDFTLRGQNLIGSTMFIWSGYRERGVFVSGGAVWRF